MLFLALLRLASYRFICTCIVIKTDAEICHTSMCIQTDSCMFAFRFCGPRQEGYLHVPVPRLYKEYAQELESII